MFDIQLFGRVEVRTRGVLLAGTDFGGDHPRRILALLALRGEMSTSELAGVLGEKKKSVESDMSVLRDHLEPGTRPRDSVVRRRDGRWSLDPDRVRIDVARFDELITAALGRPAERRVKPLTAASFVACRPLLEEEDLPWAAEARDAYRTKLADVTQVN
ncbi:AfsR/SARP family transcriptional regulator [Paractinoplanes lichenicola]|uniref:Helix-turn-helix transcriptional regulator n=1 Tax=Paractinoplanes lichenicola TaxID=2802976 RepID=A0ABS1W102_9ACTN|nr:helix-turn-helix transcriptional regulator [Actinoplanes lichenicola]MBL7260395.1 helix-turn-helix transcriptional regulator [Actinoplanes lichenicola]